MGLKTITPPARSPWPTPTQLLLPLLLLLLLLLRACSFSAKCACRFSPPSSRTFRHHQPLSPMPRREQPPVLFSSEKSRRGCTGWDFYFYFYFLLSPLVVFNIIIFIDKMMFQLRTHMKRDKPVKAYRNFRITVR